MTTLVVSLDSYFLIEFLWVQTQINFLSKIDFSCQTDMIFVQNFTLPGFQMS